MARNAKWMSLGAVGVLMTAQTSRAGFAPPKTWDFEDYATPFAVVQSPTAAEPYDDWKLVNQYGSATVVSDGHAHSGSNSLLLVPEGAAASNLMGIRFKDPANAMASRHGMVSSLFVKFVPNTLVNLPHSTVPANFEYYLTNLAAQTAGTLKIDALNDGARAQVLWTHGDKSGTEVLTTLLISDMINSWTKLEIRVDLDDTDGTAQMAYQVLVNDVSMGVRELYPDTRIVPGGTSGNWLQDVFIATRMVTQLHIDDITVGGPVALSIPDSVIVPEPACAAVLMLGTILGRRRGR